MIWGQGSQGSLQRKGVLLLSYHLLVLIIYLTVFPAAMLTSHQSLTCRRPGLGAGRRRHLVIKASSSASAAAAPKLILYTKPGCTLCDGMKVRMP